MTQQGHIPHVLVAVHRRDTGHDEEREPERQTSEDELIHGPLPKGSPTIARQPAALTAGTRGARGAAFIGFRI